MATPNDEKKPACGSTSPTLNVLASNADRLSQQRNLTITEDHDDVNVEDAENESDTKNKVPMQKRRRVTRACDECRRKKIKCDGKVPCVHCTVYSYDCTYDQPSNRRRNPAPQYIEALEQRLQKAEAILRSVLPSLDLDDPKLDAHSVEQIVQTHRDIQRTRPQSQSRAEDDAQMRSMVDGTGSLDLDDTGFYDYHGHSSGYNFLNRLKKQFGDQWIPKTKGKIEHKTLSNIQESSPKSLQSSPFEAGISLSNDLPLKNIAIELCRNAIDDCCALQRPLHRPTFFRRLDAIYATEPENYTNEHVRFLPLLYAAMALGSLFGQNNDEENNPDRKGYKGAIDQGVQYFNVAKSMIDVTDCRDLVSIQTVMFMILFLQGTSGLAVCYAYIGCALRSCARLGMHRKLLGNFNVIEQEERKRLFWQIRKMDIYVGAMLGLPQMLSNDDIDQELPFEVDDGQITANAIVPSSSYSFPLIKATNAHTKLLKILRKVVKYIYPITPPKNANGQAENHMISHSLIRELEQDLQEWMNELPMELRPSDDASTELARVQQLLRMSYAYVQMSIYRPFLHYVAASQAARTDKRSFACAAACVSVARNIVHITSEMKRRGLLLGAYWFVMYTTYFAILSLLYFVIENPDSSTSKDILKDAVEGRETIASLATRSLAADRCTSSLSVLFDALPEKLNERRSSLRTFQQANTAKKRPPPSTDAPFLGPQHVFSHAAPFSGSSMEPKFSAPARARTLPQEYLAAKVAKRSSMPDSPVVGHASFPFTPDSGYAGNLGTPSDKAGYNSSHIQTPTSIPLDFGTPALIQGQLPDLRNVMFGDNPWAYPNQPMSTLDTMQNPPFGSETASPAQHYSTPLSVSAQTNLQRQNFEPSFVEQSHTLPHQFYNNPNDMAGGAQSMQHPAHQQSNLQTAEDDYWSHAPAKGNFRTSLTPGGPGINLNLDDIFGNSQGWSMPMGMELDNSNLQAQSFRQWPSQGQSSWQSGV